MLNKFIEKYLYREDGKLPDFKNAWAWYMRYIDGGDVPDVTTFSLLMGYCCSINDSHRIELLLSEMKKYNIDPNSLRGVYPFSEDDPLPFMEEKNSLTSLDSNLLETVSDLSSTLLNSSEKSDLRQTSSVGVKILRKTLSSLKISEDASAYEIQQQIETRLEEAAVEENDIIKEKLPKEIRELTSNAPKEWTVKWFNDLSAAIKENLPLLESESERKDDTFIPFLKLLKAEQMSRIVLTEFLKLPVKRSQDKLFSKVDMGGIDGSAELAVSILVRIGESIEREYNLQQKKHLKNKKHKDAQKLIHNLHADDKLFNPKYRKIASDLAHSSEKENTNLNWAPSWPASVKVSAASWLSVLLIQNAKVLVPNLSPTDFQRDILIEEPAFSHEVIKDSYANHGIFRIHDLVFEKLSDSSPRLHPRNLPMIIKPKPWLTRQSGGYIMHTNPVIRTRFHGEHWAYISAADEQRLLDTVYEALDVLGSTAWKINERVYEVVKEVWNSGQEFTEFPAEVSKPAKSAKPSDFSSWDIAKKREWYAKRTKESLKYLNALSQRCDMNYKIEIARAVSYGVTIYFPHNLDFRGRAYPMPAHLNHIGNDFCRGLLLFDKKKRLGERGLMWLKIQVSNLMGHDKISFNDRVKFCEDNLENVFDSADSPLTGNRWWVGADSPWQCLATCIELTDALRSPVPEDFESCLHVHQDGTCNGLQHYAALGGDSLGAAQVNLIPNSKPADIYTAVAEKVNQAIEKLCIEGCETSKLMRGKITRKLVKQTVMTNTYGVTFMGAKDQVKSRIKENPTLYPFTDIQIQKCSVHIATLIFQCLGELFGGARKIQKWLNTAAMSITYSISESDIPKIQIDDAKFLDSIGCLPTGFSMVSIEKTQVMNNAAETFEESVISGEETDSLFDAAFIDCNKESNDDSNIQKEAEETFVITDEDLQGIDPEAIKKASEILRNAKTKIEKENERKPNRMNSVIWTSPLGVPIVQPYRESKIKLLATQLQFINVIDESVPMPVNFRKQSAAFPPNFIHSLDATHMMLTALECKQAGLDFASVHDSYWTHACDVDSMSQIIRSSFIKLHSLNILQNLRQEILDRNGKNKLPVKIKISNAEKLLQWKMYLEKTGRKRKAALVKLGKEVSIDTWVDFCLPDIPPKGDFDLEVVKESPYFFH